MWQNRDVRNTIPAPSIEEVKHVLSMRSSVRRINWSPSISRRSQRYSPYPTLTHDSTNINNLSIRNSEQNISISLPPIEILSHQPLPYSWATDEAQNSQDSSNYEYTMQYNSALTCVSCSLCQHKIFKNDRGLRLYWQRVHQNKNSNYSNQTHTNTSICSCVFCVLCPKKSYKNQKGLSRYETIVHSHYNTPRAGLIPQPLEVIIEFKNILIYMIQIKLKTSAKEARQQ
ncbi:11357_t:CDS:2, partial [Dentiscutata heterogama]